MLCVVAEHCGEFSSLGRTTLKQQKLIETARCDIILARIFWPKCHTLIVCNDALDGQILARSAVFLQKTFFGHLMDVGPCSLKFARQFRIQSAFCRGLQRVQGRLLSLAAEWSILDPAVVSRESSFASLWASSLMRRGGLPVLRTRVASQAVRPFVLDE